MNRAFCVALVDETETTFDPSHVREDLVVFDLTMSQSEGDFCNLALDVANPRVGLIAPGRPRWIWVGWNPHFDPFASESADAEFADIVPLFFGRIQGVPADFIGETVTLNFMARPLDYDTQKAALADTLRELPWFDGVWFAPDNRYDPDNVLESRAALWHTDRVTHEVTTSNIITGEDGTIELTGDDVLADSIRIAYGNPPCRQVNVTATYAWDQIASGQVQIVGTPLVAQASDGPVVIGMSPYIVDTYTGAGLQDNWPKPGQTINGDWRVGDLTSAVRLDDTGKDVWTYTTAIAIFGKAQQGFGLIMPPWQTEQYLLNVYRFPAHLFVIKKWKLAASLSAAFDTKRGKSEVVQFSLRSNTQSILTDSTDGEAIDLQFSTSEIAAPVGQFSDGTLDFPIGKPWARSYATTDRGALSNEYLLLIARAHLLASARCVDVTFELPWNKAIEEGVNCRKNVILSDDSLPGHVVGGKIKSYTLRANGDSGNFTCEVAIGCTIGKGGTITAQDGTPTYVAAGYVDPGYQVYTSQYVMPVAGEIAYRSILGEPCDDDGFDFDRMTAGRVLKVAPTWTNFAPEQEELMKSLKDPFADLRFGSDKGPKEPSELYGPLNTKQTTVTFELKPLNSGPFNTNYFMDTTLLSVPKTIDLEYEDSSS